MTLASQEANLDSDNPPVSDVLEELRRCEPIFHRPEFGTTRADSDNMMDSAFWEVGASGRRYTREYVLDELERRRDNPTEDTWEASDFRCLEIAPDNYLLTYMLIQDHVRVTRRSTIWRRTAGGWKILYHQGTIVEGE